MGERSLNIATGRTRQNGAGRNKGPFVEGRIVQQNNPRSRDALDSYGVASEPRPNLQYSGLLFLRVLGLGKHPVNSKRVNVWLG